MKPIFTTQKIRTGETSFALPLSLSLALFLFLPLSSPAATYAGADTFIVTNAATATIAATNHPTSGGSQIAWHPSGIIANFRDAPTGNVLVVRHIRSGLRNPYVSTNTISVTNVLYTSGTGSYAAILWDPAGTYPINPATDTLQIQTSSTNAEIILNKSVW